MPLPMYSSLDELIGIYSERLKKDTKNMERVKKFYDDDCTFTLLMNGIIAKDTVRFEKFMENIVKQTTGTYYPNPWRVLYVVLDIVQNEGTEIHPFDTLTKSFPSKSLTFHGWTFSWVHGEGTLTSIFNNHDELVYRF